jgi:hypothetical protein
MEIQELIEKLANNYSLPLDIIAWIESWINHFVTEKLNRHEALVMSQLTAVIAHLKTSFDKANEQLNNGRLDDLKIACAELVISNAEARQMLSKLLV